MPGLNLVASVIRDRLTRPRNHEDVKEPLSFVSSWLINVAKILRQCRGPGAVLLARDNTRCGHRLDDLVRDCGGVRCHSLANPPLAPVGARNPHDLFLLPAAGAVAARPDTAHP